MPLREFNHRDQADFAGVRRGVRDEERDEADQGLLNLRLRVEEL